MDIAEYQTKLLELFSEIDKLPNKKEHTKQSATVHLMEEIGEIARQVTSEYHRPEKFDKNNLGEELADVIMFIVVLAKLYEIDISNELKDSLGRLDEKIKKLKMEENS
jgi:NTP pyrophosphatase (non-canonical NTP hydrolase)